MIPVKINSINTNLTFSGTKNTGRLVKALAGATKNSILTPLIGLGSCVGMGITYQKNNSGDAFCKQSYINPIKLKEQAIRYNEKEKQLSDCWEEVINGNQNISKQNETESDTEKNVNSENRLFSPSILPNDLEDKLLPDFRERKYDDDFYNDLNNIDDTPIKMAEFKKKADIIKNKQLKTIAETICRKEQLSKATLDYIRDIDAGISNITDSKILKNIKAELKRLANIDYNTEHFDNSENGMMEYFFSLEKIANIVDVYNTMTGKYSRYKTSDLAYDTVYLDKSKPTEYIKFFRKNNPQQLHNFIKALNSDTYKKHPLVADFESSLKTEALELLTNQKEQLDYMYEKYYLSTITDASVRKLCREISRTYGVKVLLSNKTIDIQRTLKIIKKELDDWTKASNGKAKLPRILDLNSCDTRYEDFAAYADIRGNIHHNGAKIYSPRVLRHEIMHLNEPLLFTRFTNDIERANLIRSIIKVKDKANRWETGVLNWDNCKYREEFLKAGINPEHVKYAYTNVNEFLSVIAEGDLSQCSSEFKEDLIKLGMPKYVFSLQTDDINVKNNVKRVKDILKDHPNASYDELVEYIEEKIDEEPSPEERLLSALLKYKETSPEARLFNALFETIHK